MLIAYWYHREDARRGARMALIVTAGGGFSLLAGTLILGKIVGSYDLDAILVAGDVARAHPWYAPLLILILLGALTKSAQFPFHFWLPQAMAAPTPVSAYLHSATLVKAGVFLLVRLWPVLSGTSLWFWLVCSSGAATLLIGAFSATFQRDIKGVLAYSTVSHLGLITLLLGMNSALALIAAVFHMINHATFKASLFIAAGIVDHETGTRDLRRLGGLARCMPMTTVLSTVAAAMAGVPLLNGFLSKEMFFAESILAGHESGLRLTFPAIATLAGIFSVAYSVRFIHRVFFGPLFAGVTARPARAYARHAAAEHVACRRLSARWHLSRVHGRPCSGDGGTIHSRRALALVRTRGLARSHGAVFYEYGGARRRSCLLYRFGPRGPRHDAEARAITAQCRKGFRHSRCSCHSQCSSRGPRGPSAQDRVLAFDTLYLNGLLSLLLLGIRTRSTVYFDMALLIALFGFIGSAALAKFLLRGEVIEP
jgi:multisubunit Na+/H+ antiporter MnhF subunit